jgi:hypothetical protein
MIIDFARHYTTVKSFTDLNGTHCTTCNIPFTITTNVDYITRITCFKCTLSMRFYLDAYQCSSIDMLDYKNFGFYYQPKSNTRPVDVISISSLTKYTGWLPFSNNTSFLLMSEVEERIASGEADRICAPIPVVAVAPITLNLNI